MIFRQISVKGLVQGVFFRVSTREKAKELGITGWVKNESDGSVLIQASGDEVMMNEFVSWCRHGPASARVDIINVIEISEQYFIGFEVR